MFYIEVVYLFWDIFGCLKLNFFVMLYSIVSFDDLVLLGKKGYMLWNISILLYSFLVWGSYVGFFLGI